ncbi:YceI family protein [Emcibacter sp. SYSU 3D8]|uniref:YceI family protein n=1 Tax=Emcibacter sp. SYSU 3D8 TaxID=3133969 RepID=UPI0031FEE624
MTRWLTVSLLTACLAASGAWAAGGKHKEDAAGHTRPAPAQAAKPAAPTWRIVPGKSSLTFTATQLGQEFTGRFPRFAADLTLDPSDLARATLTASVDLSAIDAGDKQRNEALPGSDWFDVADHPRATFRSRKIVKKDDRRFEATGVMSIKGIERQVTIPFTLTPDGDRAAIKAGFSITRTDFKVGDGQWATGQWVGLDVRIVIDAVASKSGT